MKPVIGITCNYLPYGDFAINEGIGGAGQHWQLLAQNYLDAVEASGGVPIIIPIHKDLSNTLALLDHLDGIILSGGNDINPILYNEMPSKKLGNIIPNRDRQEIFILNHVLENTDIAVFGICRGLQLLNIALGGSLHQDLEEEGMEKHSILQVPMNEVSHNVVVEEDSNLFKIVNEKNMQVNSLHHQSVKEVGKGLKVTALDYKGVVEAVELPHRKAFTMAVQWHPETLFSSYPQQKKIFDAFITNSNARGK